MYLWPGAPKSRDTLALIIFAGNYWLLSRLAALITVGLGWVAGKAILFYLFRRMIGIYIFPLLGKLQL